MRAPLRFWALLALPIVLGLFGSALAANTKVVIRPASPQATSTPKPDSYPYIVLPQPSAAPSCAVGDVKLYADPNGCPYLCAKGRVNVITSGGSTPFPITCVFPTPQATATP